MKKKISENQLGIELRKKGEIYQVFDQISKKYDSTNTLLSFGQDSHWRRKLIRNIQIPSSSAPHLLLDIATGTGEVLKQFYKTDRKHWITLGIDLSIEMMLQSKKKFSSTAQSPLFCVMDALRLGIKSDSMDTVTLAFGIRNFNNMEQTIKEIKRVLKPGGQLLILEFGLPKKGIWRNIYLFYLKNVLPCLGRIWTKHNCAYEYLSKSICEFPSHEAFLEILTKEGFENSQYIQFQKGAVLLYLASKP